MNNEKKLELINRGKESDIVLSLFGDRIRQASAKALDKLKSSYRAGQADALTLQSGVASICALDDLYAELVRDVKTGNSASKDIHDNRESNNHFPIA